jgi:Uma2 family endonuclease
MITKVTPAKFSVQEYHQIIEAGILAYRKVELVEGIIVEMAPEGTEHSYYGQSLADIFRLSLSGQILVRENKPITLSNNTEPEPDIALVQLPSSRYLSHHPYPEDIYLLIEISKSTLAFDSSVKRKSYAKEGIKDYWIVDIINKQLKIYRSPFQGDYQEITTLKANSILSPLAFPNTIITVQQIFAS